MIRYSLKDFRAHLKIYLLLKNLLFRIFNKIKSRLFYKLILETIYILGMVGKER